MRKRSCRLTASGTTKTPHQARDNHDQPPQHRFAEPPTLALLPETVDPDAWLSHYHHHRYRRHVNSQGAMQLWKSTYYVGQVYRNQTVSVRLDAPQRVIHLEIGNSLSTRRRYTWLIINRRSKHS